MDLPGIVSRFISVTGFAILLCLAIGTPCQAAERPNIVYILADDLGWNDVGFRGSPIKTPNLDRLAQGGAILNAFYVQPHSTQTRAALMTGRYPMRYGLQTASIMPTSRYGLPEEERTLADSLKDAGYATAFVGKWQLGHGKPEHWPTRRGFDYFYGSLSGQVGFMLDGAHNADWRRGDKPVKENGYVTSLLAKDAVNVINKRNPSKPMLLMLSFAAPAAPYGAPKELLDKFSDIADPFRRRYVAAVSALDGAVGQVVATLEQNKLLDNTLIIFHSDNGGALPTRFKTGDADVENFAADNGIFREGRGSLYEGGVRVVAIASWPGKIRPKSVVTDMLHATDMFTTLTRLGGVSAEPSKPLDGVDQWPALAEGRPGARKEILLNVEEFRGAIRSGEWKLVVHAALPRTLELFDISNDPEEAQNLAERSPERLAQMLAKLNEYAYEMAPAAYLDEVAESKTGQSPIVWRYNPVRR
jgi:arylsulfatase A-like enzyme